MNNSTALVIDSSCDLPREYIEDNNLTALGLTFHFNGQDLEDDFGKTLTYKQFYDGVRRGLLPTTSQINVYQFTETFRKLIDEKKSVIYIGFSSALSGCVNNALTAKKIIEEEDSTADITVIDTKSACIGEGLLVYYACEMLKSGASRDEIILWLEETSPKIDHWFVVDDLNHLKRGGRLTSTKAVIGTLFQIKPIIHLDENGSLVNVFNAKGKKQGLRMLVDLFKQKALDPEDHVIGISHGDCIEDAEFLRAMVLQRFKVKKVIINNVGPVIGSHVGPGMVSLCFFTHRR